MPNHITNIIEIDESTASSERIEEILNSIKSNESGIGSIDFDKIIPMPDSIFRGNLGNEEMKLYAENNWYDWSIKNWGTKWKCETFAA